MLKLHLSRSPIKRLFSHTALTRNEYLHPILRQRAEQLEKEYKTLNDAIADSYESETAIRLARLTPIVEKFESLKAAEAELEELTELVSDPSLGADARQELQSAQEQISKLSNGLKLQLVPTNPFVDKQCLVEIRPGIGGSEAGIFAQDLLTMYQNYCLKRGWPNQLVSHVPTPAGGVSEAILHITEPGAYERLQYEGGIHRVQRVPETETKGRVHTSTAAVVVLPDLGESEADAERAFKAGELRIDVMRASGSGGQHVNTTESAVRIVHLPTGLVVTCQDERSQHKNKARALMVLRARLAERERVAKQNEDRAARTAQVSTTERSDKIRTYNYPQNRVTDHRSGYSQHHLSEIMAGTRFDELVDSCNVWAQSEAVKQLTGETN